MPYRNLRAVTHDERYLSIAKDLPRKVLLGVVSNIFFTMLRLNLIGEEHAAVT